MFSVHTVKRWWLWPVVAGLVGTVGLSAPAGADPSATDLSRTLDAILADSRMAGAAASVVVADAATGKAVYRHRADDRLMPASNTKLLTSVAATALLGTDYRYTTDVLTTGKRRGSTLKGDLYLRGSGDPTTLAADYDKLAAKVAESGVKKVDGRLVADDTRFDAERLGRSWAADDESAYYSAQTSALTVAPDTDYDSGTVVVRAEPGKEPGDKPKVTVTPKTDYVKIANAGETVASGGTDTLAVAREHGTNTIEVTGDIPVGASATVEWVSVWEPTGYAAAVFRDALARHGVRVTDGTRLGRATPSSAEALAAHRSMPLSELLVPFMKLSNNMHAEALVKTMGYRSGGEGSWEDGLAAVSGYLEKEGVDPAVLRQVDGSGLSRMNVVPAREFADLLLGVRDADWYRTWAESLPVACGTDRMVGGTLRTRMCGTPAAGNARAKTGSLTGASGLSGYVKDKDERELVFSVLLNNYLASSVKDIEDKVVVALASYSEKGGAVAPSRVRSGTGEPASRTDVECSWLKPARC